MSTLKLFLLGPPRIELDGVPVDIRRRKALALLVYLAVSNHPRSRDALATLLFPDLDQQRARAYLRRDLAVLNTSLAGEWLSTDREMIELKRGSGPGQIFWLDIDHFGQILAAYQNHCYPPQALCSDCLRLLTEAVSLYSDDFLAGFTLRDSPEFDEWQFFQTESLRQKLASTLERLVAGLTQGCSVLRLCHGEPSQTAKQSPRCRQEIASSASLPRNDTRRIFRTEQPWIAAILNDPVPDLSQFRPETPPVLAELIRQMLVKERDLRLDSMRQIAAGLEVIQREL